MSRLFRRKVSLTVGDVNGQGLDLSALRIRFDVRQWDLQTPNNAQIRVFNVADKTAEQVRNEYTRLVLQVGYEDGPFGVIFDGSIVQAKRGRENATDTYLDIVAADGDEAYNFAILATSLTAGTTAKDRLDKIVGAMADHGVTAGYTPELPPNQLPRGKVFFGMARDLLRSLSDSTDTKWSIQNGQVQLCPIDGVIPGDVVVLNAASGMVGIPEQTQEGIRVRTLARPDVKIGRVVRIDNASINRAPLAVSLQGQVQNAFLPRVADDGLYRVIVAQHVGDTRGNDFYTDLTCIALGDPVTQTLANKGYA